MVNRLIKKYGKGINKKCFMIVIFMSMYLVFQYDIFRGIQITNFTRSLGMATSKGIDISKLINSFYFFFFLIVVVIIIALALFSIFYSRQKDYNFKIAGNTIDHINIVAGVGGVSLIINYITKYNTGASAESIFPTICFWIILCVLFYHIIRGGAKVILNWNDYKWILLASFTILFTFRIFVNISLVIGFPVILLFLTFLADSLKQVKNLDRLKIATVPIHFIIFSFCSISEFSVILNENKIFINNVSILYFISMILFVVICIWRFLKNTGSRTDWESNSYIGVLLSVALLVGLPPIHTEVTTDLFEQANISLPISQFFSFGKIPFIETFNAHMLSDFIYGFLYKVLNRDLIGSFFGLYNSLEKSFDLIVMYFVLKEFFRKDTALIFVLAFPFFSGTQMFWGGICFVSVLALIKLLKKKTILSYYIFWIALAFSVLYRGDLGLSLGLGCIVALIVIAIIERNVIKVKLLITSFIKVLLLFSFVYCFLCVLKGVNPLSRLQEFYSLMLQSNQNWAYGTMGDSSTFAFAFAYLIVPTFGVFILLHLIWLFYIETQEHRSDIVKMALLLTLGFAYFINFPRILVRHSLVEMPLINLMFTMVLLFPLYIYYYYRKKRNFNYFIYSFLSIILIAESMSSQNASTLMSSLDVANQRVVDHQTFARHLGNKKITRVGISKEMKSSYVYISNEINSILGKDETFLDFSNQTMLYSLTGRENPVYISQSPGLLVNEFTQEQFINEVKHSSVKVPIVVMAENAIKFGLTIDGIMNTYRYYKVAEYIYQNYTPIEIIGDYAIWYKNDRKDIKNKITQRNHVISSGNLNFSNMIVNNASLENDTDGVKFLNSTDPNIIGLEKMLPKQRINPMSLSIKYTSSTDGIMQLFYTTDDEKNFNEKNSVSVKVHKGDGTSVMSIPYHSNIKYRLDLPDNSIFKIKGIQFGNQVVDANYFNEQAHNYELGDIPYLWGNRDSKNSAKNKVMRRMSINNSSRLTFNSQSVDKKKGNYLKLELNSLSDSTINLELGYTKDGIDNKRANFNFNVEKGKHTYLIRISSDYYWYLNGFNYIHVSDKNINMKNAEILEGD